MRVPALPVLATVCVTLAGAFFAGWSPGAEPAAAADASSAPEPVPIVLSGDVPVGCRVVTLAVDGMRCGSCAHKVYSALLALPDVSDAAVDVYAGRAQAVVPVPVDVEQVVAAVTVPGLTLLPLE